MSVAVLGAGAFGTALAVALAAKGPVVLWGRRIGWTGAVSYTHLTPVSYTHLTLPTNREV